MELPCPLCPDWAADEMLGTPKPKESLAGLWRARSVLGHDHGNLIINIAEPISLFEFARGKINRQLQTRSPPYVCISPVRPFLLLQA